VSGVTEILNRHPDVLTNLVCAGNRASPPRCPNDAPLAIACGKRVTTPLYKGAFMASNNIPQPVYDHDYDDALALANSALRYLKNPTLDEIPPTMIGPVVVGSVDLWWRSKKCRNEFVIVQAQQYWVHDMSEVSPTDTTWNVTCTCGLIVAMPDDPEFPMPFAERTNYFARSRHNSIEWQREFFAAPGHRDPFHNTVLGAFLICVSELDPVSSPLLELQCGHCGWLGETKLVRDFTKFVRFDQRQWIDSHNAGCSGDGVEVFDEDALLLDHKALEAYFTEKRRKARECAESARDDEASAE
jgi:hypothetical protein